jgi:hypothetical protein
MKRLNQELARKLMKQEAFEYIKKREKKIELLKKGKTAFVDTLKK